MLGDVDPEFAWVDGGWSLTLPRPDAWRLEYQLTVRRGEDTMWTTDPGNPRRVPNPFGEKSEIRFPGLPGADWLLTAPDGPLRERRDPGRPAGPAGAGAALVARRACRRTRRRRCWSRTTAPTWPSAARLLSWATGCSRESFPIRVALLDPPHGLRDTWYSANPDYSDHLAEVVLPAIDRQGADRPGDRARRQPGRAGMLALQRRHPGSISALALQSGSFFTPRARLRRRAATRYFNQVCAAVRMISRRPRPVRRRPPRGRCRC